MRAVTLAAVAAATTTSAVPLSPFVASGAYARAVALAADCNATYIPALDERLRRDGSAAGDGDAGADVAAAPAGRPGRGWAALAMMGPGEAALGRAAEGAAVALRRALGSVRVARYEAGAELEYHYRPLAMRPEWYRLEPDSAFAYGYADRPRTPVVGMGAAAHLARPLAVGETRLDTYGADYWAITVASTRTMQGCTRILIQPTPSQLQVGIYRASTINNAGPWSDLPAVLRRSAGVTVPGIDPDTIRGQIKIKVYENGFVKPKLPVVVWTDSRGQPGRYGHTVGHEHIAAGAAPPSIRLQGQTSPGQRVRVETDVAGEKLFTVRPGYRGQPEAVWAEATVGGTTSTVARTVVVRHKVFVHFAQAFGYNELRPVTPSDQFPFVLTGRSSRHGYAHWIQRDKVALVKGMLMTVWQQDPGRRASPVPRYWVMNDMSLEYGGHFRISGSDCNYGAGGHQTHHTGVDFDINPCWSRGNTAEVNGEGCLAGGGLRINQRVLGAHVIGDLGGAILLHSMAFDNTPAHFHLRVPER